MADRLLINLFLLTRSESLFRTLYKKHTPYLYRLVISLSGDSAIADDMVQEIWIRAIEKLGQFKWQSSLKTWLSGIVINCCREYNRRKKYSKLEDLPDSKAAYFNHSDLNMDLRKALVQLPEGYREVLLLHDMEGFKHNEIALMLDIHPGTSKSQLHYARLSIKELLK